MNLTLQHAGDYIRTGRAPKMLRRIILRVRSVFTFVEERTNRLARYVRVTRAYKAGKPVTDIVTEFGCCKQTVLRYARLAGLEKRPKHFDAKIRDATIAMYKDGRPIAEIQARLGVSQAYISKTATEEGINRRKFKKRR